jgi:hypothetical protein
VRRLTVLAAGICSIAVASSAGAATSPWVAKADSVCAAWHKKGEALLGAHPAQPKSAAQWYAFMQKVRPIEAGMLHGLQAIALARPVGASHALALAAADLREIDVALTTYRGGHTAAFMSDAGAWITDQRASKAFAALGAKSCA